MRLHRWCVQFINRNHCMQWGGGQRVMHCVYRGELMCGWHGTTGDMHVLGRLCVHIKCIYIVLGVFGQLLVISMRLGQRLRR